MTHTSRNPISAMALITLSSLVLPGCNNTARNPETSQKSYSEATNSRVVENLAKANVTDSCVELFRSLNRLQIILEENLDDISKGSTWYTNEPDKASELKSSLKISLEQVNSSSAIPELDRYTAIFSELSGTLNEVSGIVEEQRKLGVVSISNDESNHTYFDPGRDTINNALGKLDFVLTLIENNSLQVRQMQEATEKGELPY